MRRLTPLVLLAVLLLGTGVGLPATFMNPALADAAATPVKEIIVWLEPTDVHAQIVEVRTELSKVNTVHGCVFHSKLTDYREAKHLLSKTEYRMLTLSATPASIRCVATTSALSAIVTRFSGQPGVFHVTIPPRPNRLPIRSGA